MCMIQISILHPDPVPYVIVVLSMIYLILMNIQEMLYI